MDSLHHGADPERGVQPILLTSSAGFAQAFNALSISIEPLYHSGSYLPVRPFPQWSQLRLSGARSTLQQQLVPVWSDAFIPPPSSHLPWRSQIVLPPFPARGKRGCGFNFPLGHLLCRYSILAKRGKPIPYASNLDHRLNEGGKREM